MNDSLTNSLQQMQTFFASGATRSYAFRYKQLQQFKKALLHFEAALHTALYTDLKKSAEESWVTETGFLLSEINDALKNLRQWMKPKKVKTNLVNFPSRSYVYKEPLGIVLIIGPWNYPVQLLLTPLVGAIAAGNCAVVKASEFAPATAAVMEKLISSIYPKNYVLYVQGDGAQVVPQLMNNIKFDHIFYTGSIPVSKIIYEAAARQLIPVTLELGGKSPCVIESDANLKVAARRIAMTKFSNAGQMCVAPDYVLVHTSVKDVFIQTLKSTITGFFSDDPASNYNYGKVVNDKQFNRLISYLQQGTIIHGGNYNAATLYIQPTLLTDVSVDSPVMQQEIFGPILPIIPFTTFKEAQLIINHHPNPLAFYVFTESSEKEKQWLMQIPFGGGCVNNASWHLTNYNLPFGGRGNSGMGAYHGRFSFDVFSHKKAIMKTPTWLDPAIKYPPFKGKLGLFKKIIR